MPAAAGAERRLVEAARRGRRLRYEADPPGGELAEAMLAAPTRWLRTAVAELPGLRGVDLDAALERLSHEWLELRGERLHLEVHPAQGPRRGAVVYVHGLGDHVRRATPFGAAIAAAGYDAILLDRRGHGLSEGWRGDATLTHDMAATELALGYARRRFGGPVALVGDSLGGIMGWYLLTLEPDADAVVCHCINHPAEANDPSLRYKAPATRALARVAPLAPVAVTQIADYSQVALEELTRAYFFDRPDRLFNFAVTARAAASYLSFRPTRPWEAVSTPVLVVIGDEDRMVSRAHVERCLARGHPPRTRFLPLAGMGHQLYLDHLAEALPAHLEWLDEALPQP